MGVAMAAGAEGAIAVPLADVELNRASAPTVPQTALDVNVIAVTQAPTKPPLRSMPSNGTYLVGQARSNFWTRCPFL